MNIPSGTVLKSHLLRLLLFIFLMAVFFGTGMTLFADFKNVKSLLGGISSKWFAAIILSVLFNYALRFFKWSFFLRLLNLKVPLFTSLWIFLSGFTMVLSPGKVGEVVKSFLLKSRFGFPLAQTAPIVAAERITDLLGLFSLAICGYGSFGYGGPTLGITGVIILGGVIFITRPSFWEILDKKVFSKIPVLLRFQPTLIMLKESTRNLLTIKSLSWMIPLSALSWGGEGLALYFIFCSFNIDVSSMLGIAIFAQSFSSIVGALSFVPGGLLVTEGTLGMFFIYSGIGKDFAVSATLLIRVVTLWFAVILGTVVFFSGCRGADLECLIERKKKGKGDSIQ